MVDFVHIYGKTYTVDCRAYSNVGDFDDTYCHLNGREPISQRITAAMYGGGSPADTEVIGIAKDFSVEARVLGQITSPPAQSVATTSIVFFPHQRKSIIYVFWRCRI